MRADLRRQFLEFVWGPSPRPQNAIRVNSCLFVVTFLFEIVNHDLLADGFENFLHELDVTRVVLVIVLRFFVAEDDVEGDLVALVDDGAVALRGAADVEMQYAWDIFQVFVGASDEFIGGIGESRFGPENDNVRKHRRIEMVDARMRKPVLGGNTYYTNKSNQKLVCPSP